MRNHRARVRQATQEAIDRTKAVDGVIPFSSIVSDITKRQGFNLADTEMYSDFVKSQFPNTKIHYGK